LPTEKREEEEPKREGERWLKKTKKTKTKTKGENVKSGSKKWMRDFGRKNSIFLSQE
jgi:hypothetical protein